MRKEKKNNKARKVDLLISRRLIKLGSTIVFIAVLLVAYFLLASLLKAINLPKLDTTGARMFTLSQETKDVLNKIDKDVDIYALNFSNYDNEIEIIKGFERENSKIHVTVIPNTTENPAALSQFGLDESFTGACAIVSSGEHYQMVLSRDMYSQYGKKSKAINLLEEKITNSIVSVTNENKKKICIYATDSNHVMGESNISFINDLMMYGNDVELLKEYYIPDDCDLLVLPGFSTDITEGEANGILDYIRKGKNILIFHSNDVNKSEYPNFQKILAEYNLKVDAGIILEEENENNYNEDPNYLVEKTLPSSITNGEDKERYLFSINTAPIKYLENDNTVSYEVLCETSDKAFVRTDIDQYDMKGNPLKEKTSLDGEYQKEIIGILANKKYDGIESKMILFGSDEIAIDVAVGIIDQNGETQSSQYLSYMYQNKLILIDSIKYLLDNDEIIRIEKVDLKPEFSGSIDDLVNFRFALVAGSVSVVVVGFIVWYVRRKRI